MAKLIEEWFIKKPFSLFTNIIDEDNMTEISKKSGVTHNHISILFEVFEKNGLVTRVKCKEKHKNHIVKIFLTKKGRKLQKLLINLLEQFRR